MNEYGGSIASIPTAYFELGYEYENNYGNLDESDFDNRWVTEFGYRIPGRAIQLFFFSNVSIKDGPEEIGAGLVYSFKTQKLANLLGSLGGNVSGIGAPR